MLFHTSPLFSLYFGDAHDGIFQQEYLAGAYGKNLIDNEHFTDLVKLMNPADLVFLHQTHSADGLIITEHERAPEPFKREGDFIVTNRSGLGIGVMTADCLPIIFYDAMHHAVAVVHAGWRGSVQSIAQKAVRALQDNFNTQLDRLQIFFGPAGKACCYEVTAEFLTHLDPFPYAHEAVLSRSDKLFFDLLLFNKLQLEDAGIKKEAFHDEYNVCTICDDAFASYRRQGEHAGRQMSVAILK